MSFFLLLLYLVCIIIRPQDWVSGMVAMPLIDILAIFTAFFLFFERAASRSKVFIRVPQNKLMVGLFVSIVLSHLVHTYFAGLIASFNKFIVLFILFYLMLNVVNTGRKYQIAVWLIIAMVFVLVFQGMYQVDHGYGWAGQNITFDKHRNEARINWIGIFNDPNDLALLFVVAVGILLSSLFGKVNFIQRAASLGAIAFLFYGIFLTNSRGGLLALMATLFFFFVRKTKRFVFGSIIGGLCIFAIFAIGPSRLGIISVEEGSAYSRVELWYQGILLFKANPLFGVGFDMYMDSLPQTAHNSYILALAELGVLGLFFWMALIYSSLKGLSVIQAKDEQLRDSAIGLQSALVGFCVAAFFLSRTYVIMPYLLFALSGSLMHVAARKNNSLNFDFTRADAKHSLKWSFLVIAFAYAIIKFTYA